MSTRSSVIVDDGQDRIAIYRHSDGYPHGPHGVIAQIPQALKYAWELPRFEAKDFSAALVAAWKQKRDGGGIYIDGDCKKFEKVNGDVEWVYVVRPENWKTDTKAGIVVDVYDVLNVGMKKPIHTLALGEAYPE